MHEEMSIALQVAILAVQIGVILFAARLAGNLAAGDGLADVLRLGAGHVRTIEVDHVDASRNSSSARLENASKE